MGAEAYRIACANNLSLVCIQSGNICQTPIHMMPLFYLQ